jgi:hypothetical protein
LNELRREKNKDTGDQVKAWRFMSARNVTHDNRGWDGHARKNWAELARVELRLVECFMGSHILFRRGLKKSRVELWLGKIVTAAARENHGPRPGSRILFLRGSNQSRLSSCLFFLGQRMTSPR